MELKSINDNYTKDVFEFKYQKDELEFIASDISKNHIKHLNDVYLVNIGSEYLLELKRIFKLYNIPINIDNKKSIYSTKVVQDFINNIKETKDINNSLDKVNNQDIKNVIIDIINKFEIEILDDIYINIIENELKRVRITNKILDNAINCIDINDMYLKDKYYYILNFNQGVLPRIFKDDDFISDKDKIKLGLNTSLDKYLVNKTKVINIIRNFKNITITYKLKDNQKEYIKSPLIDELHLNVINDINTSYNYSNKMNKLNLSIMLDNYIKYNEVNGNLNDLYSTYKDINYLSYNNSFNKVDYNLLKRYLNNKINISYSSMNNYFHCEFKYYINNILKLDIFEDTFQTLIGNLFHYCLSKMYEDSFDLKSTYYDYLKDKCLKPSEEFFINKLYSNLENIIENIKIQDRHSKFNEVLTEKNITIDKSSDIEIKFTGFIDKIKILKEEDITYVSIIDYKTGNVDTSLSNINDGLNMQLPVYLYLIKKEDNNVKVSGFYLQKLLNNVTLDSEEKDEETSKNLKLIGYTIDDKDIISKFDDTFINSDVISSMRVKQDGDFYSSAKIISEEKINKIVDIVDNHINEVIDSISDGEFKINPKIINNELIGCRYCKYKDICYLKEKDIVKLDYKSINEILE